MPSQVRREHSPEHSNVATATIHDRTALYVSIFSMVLSALCLGLFLMQTFLMPQIIDSKVAAGVARAEAIAHTADTNARVALDKVEQTQVQLGAAGLVKPSTH